MPGPSKNAHSTASRLAEYGKKTWHYATQGNRYIHKYSSKNSKAEGVSKSKEKYEVTLEFPK